MKCRDNSTSQCERRRAIFSPSWACPSSPFGVPVSGYHISAHAFSQSTDSDLGIGEAYITALQFDYGTVPSGFNYVSNDPRIYATDENGRYNFVNLPLGDYTISVEGSQQTTTFTVDQNNLEKDIDITIDNQPTSYSLFLPAVTR